MSWGLIGTDPGNPEGLEREMLVQMVGRDKVWLLRVCQGSRRGRAMLVLAGILQEAEYVGLQSQKGSQSRGVGSLGKAPGSLGARGLG